jgi:hypothetical protein
MRLSDTSGPDGIRAFRTLSEYRPQWALDPSRFLGMQVLPFMPSLKILSTQLVANTFLAIVIVFYYSPFVLPVLFLGRIGASQGGTQTLASSSP